MSSRAATNVKTRKAPEDVLKEKRIKRDASTDRNNIKTNAAVKPKVAPSRSTTKPLSKTSSTESKSSLNAYKSPASNTTSKTLTRPTVRKSTEGATSSRIQTTSYYPNKQQIIKNVLKSEGISVSKLTAAKPIGKPVSNVSRTNKTEVSRPKMRRIPKESDNSSDTSVSITSERPGTATLTKGLIVNANIAGPDAPPLVKEKIVLPEIIAGTESVVENIKAMNHSSEDRNHKSFNATLKPSKASDEENYEDDFDSYASDFDEYHSSSQVSSTSSDAVHLPTEGAITSSSSSEELSTPPETIKRVFSAEEEKKLDSGNFDLPEYKHKQLLDNIHEDNEASSSFKGQVNALSSLSDEGFEDGRVIRSPSTTFIDFSKVKMQIEQRRSIERGKTRGEEILEMIKLDVQSFVVLDMYPISYEAFIKSFGNRRSCQVTCQTGEDDQNEETQTDAINKCEKWTQCPIKFTKVLNESQNYLQLYKSDLLGVGTDTIAQESFKPIFSEVKLEEFLINTSRLIFNLFAEAKKSTAKNIEINSNSVPFSSGFISLNTKYKEILKGRVITKIAFANKINSKLLSVHKEMENSILNNRFMDFRCLICVWDINKADKPGYVLSCFGDINCCCFHIENSSIILGGLTDGTITMWDTSKNCPRKEWKELNQFNVILPIYTSDINSEVNSPVIFIQTAYDVIDVSNGSYEKNSIQIYTINEDSTFRVWGFIKLMANHRNLCYTLIQNQKFILADNYPELIDMQCLTATMSNLDPNHLFISTNYGCIIHCLTTKTKANPKKFSKISDEISLVTSITPCPYAPFHFLAATSAGSTVIYSRTLARPLMTFKHLADIKYSSVGNFGNMQTMSQVQWSLTRPCRFYTLSPDGQTLHCWNLAYSDMVPENSVDFEWTLKAIALSPIGTGKSNAQNTGRCYMAISTEDNIFLHVLNEHHGIQSLINYHNDIKLFMNYVNRL